jgi:hypothetical protein
MDLSGVTKVGPEVNASAKGLSSLNKGGSLHSPETAGSLQRCTSLAWNPDGLAYRVSPNR